MNSQREDLKRVAAWLALLLGMGVAVGCAHARASDPAVLAEKITRAVYADDMEAVTANLDDAAKQEVTRTGVGALSDAMHRLGAIKSFTQRSGDPDSGRYVYDVAFERGSLVARLRLDPSGKVGAYHVDDVRAGT